VNSDWSPPLVGHSPVMIRQRSGVVLNTGSISGVAGIATQGAYGPTKGAVHQLTRQMAVEWAPHGVRVNVVNPGTIDTPLSRDNMTPQSIADREARIPLGRLAHPGEVADLIAFLASPAASFITAQDIHCDGGLSQNLMAQKFYANA